MEELKLVHDFVDGTLNAADEQKFYLLLNSNEEVRNELKQLIAFKEAIKSDVRAFTPSATSTIKIFSSLGFAVPTDIHGINTTKSTNKTKSFIRKYKQGFYGAMLTSAAAIIIYFLLFFPNGDNSINITNGKNELNNQYKSSRNIPNMISKGNDLSVSQKEKTNTIIKYIYVPVKQNSDDNNVSSQPTDIASNNNVNNELSYTNIPPIKYYSTENINSNNSTIPTIVSNNNLFNYIDLEPNKLGITAEFRGNQVWSFEDSAISPKQTSRLNNLSMALFYNITDNFMVGFDLRQETFYQKYIVYDTLNNSYLYEQKPNFTSYGASLRYVWDDIEILPILGQITIGGTNAGPIFRGMLGTIYSPTQSFSFILGFEYSYLFYHHNNFSYNTSKVGINYGVSYKF